MEVGCISKLGSYLLTMQYLSEMTEDQTLTMYSGLVGLLHKEAPRVVVTYGYGNSTTLTG
jgi:urocanate hydratase